MTNVQTLIAELVCVACKRVVDATSGLSTCPDCARGEGILEIRFDLDRARKAWDRYPLAQRPRNHWRYIELLPVEQDTRCHEFDVGWTPVAEVPRLAEALGIAKLWFKDEGRNPTGSFKDRASSVGVLHAMQTGATTVACASTGNAATSLAGQAARAGLDAVIFVPATAPAAKLAQLLVYGARVVAVEGTYGQAYDLCWQACERFGWYNRNCAINPVLIEGKKTAGLEIAEHFGTRGDLPDWIAVSIGDGCTIAGIWKGLVEMHALGEIERLPRLLGVQAAGVSPIADALRSGALPKTCDGSTIADSIDVPIPRNWRKAVDALRQSNGIVTRVDDDEILSAMRIAGRHGMYAEPAAAAAVAGVVRAIADGTLERDERVLAMITGSGLKDTQAALRAGGSPLRCRPDLQEVSRALGKEH